MTYRIRHYDYGTVTFNRTDEGKSDALISACRLDNDAVFIELSFLLRTLDHVERSTRLDGASHIEALILDEYFCRALGDYMIQLDKRRISNRLKDIVIYHLKLRFW